MSLLVVGSVAFDTVETPFGRAEEVLGGSATYCSTAASYFGPVRLVAVVGDDFPAEHEVFLRGRGVDTQGLERSPGRTFRWAGRYSFDLNQRDTLLTELNVFQSFKPKIPVAYRDSRYVFLGNIDPVLQMEVLDQVREPLVVACDTMNFWIEGKSADLARLLPRVDILLINDSEVRQLARESNLVRAARIVRGMGPRTLIVKRGEYGALMFHDGTPFWAPALPLETVFDPTGAGDTFAGGFMGHLARSNDLGNEALRQAIVYGSVMASFAVQDFSLNAIRSLAPAEIEKRYRDFETLTRFQAI